LPKLRTVPQLHLKNFKPKNYFLHLSASKAQIGKEKQKEQR